PGRFFPFFLRLGGGRHLGKERGGKRRGRRFSFPWRSLPWRSFHLGGLHRGGRDHGRGRVGIGDEVQHNTLLLATAARQVEVAGQRSGLLKPQSYAGNRWGTRAGKADLQTGNAPRQGAKLVLGPGGQRRGEPQGPLHPVGGAGGLKKRGAGGLRLPRGQGRQVEHDAGAHPRSGLGAAGGIVVQGGAHLRHFRHGGKRRACRKTGKGEQAGKRGKPRTSTQPAVGDHVRAPIHVPDLS